MFDLTQFHLMLNELNLIDDEIKSLKWYLTNKECSEIEYDIFFGMMRKSRHERELVAQVIDDYCVQYVQLNELTGLLRA